MSFAVTGIPIDSGHFANRWQEDSPRLGPFIRRPTKTPTNTRSVAKMQAHHILFTGTTTAMGISSGSTGFAVMTSRLSLGADGSSSSTKDDVGWIFRISYLWLYIHDKIALMMRRESFSLS
jgi:hypothetical protein